MITPSSTIKGLPDSNNNYPIWKKVIQVGDNPPAIVAVIDESIVKQLHIDENTWVQEILTSEGILLKFLSKKIESSHGGRQRGQEDSLTNGGSETS